MFSEEYMRDFSKANYKDANIQTRLVVLAINYTSYRFPKHDGLFSRGSKSRNLLSKLGVSAIDVNFRCRD
jgi:hypothetical protein